MTADLLLDTFRSPPGALARAAGRRALLAPLLAATAAALLATAVALPRLDLERAGVERLDKEQQPGQPEPTDHQREEAAAQARKVGALSGWAGAALGPSLQALAVAAALLAGLRTAGGRPAFRPTLAVTAHALLPLALERLLAIPALLRAGRLRPEALDTVLPANLAAWLPPGAPPRWLAPAASLDLFALWAAALLVLGLAPVAGVSRRRAAAVVGALWAGYVVTAKLALPALAGGAA
ncbi:YIP1 family protein [Anaeromyxobacter paludicola]|uniref:Yip1 domain-containing protein n=1 Tax=Anaeromyxobacter paludicola TaxID=2918171 RepID=A0ABM7XDJ9_9BACT|nr:YIP1 family protein [Anaeromyxobacter paludicola]BDG09938.1 hypothetical protein AMPC_30510 [Anaeromyxobacter paludicola]